MDKILPSRQIFFPGSSTITNTDANNSTAAAAAANVCAVPELVNFCQITSPNSSLLTPLCFLDDFFYFAQADNNANGIASTRICRAKDIGVELECRLSEHHKELILQLNDLSKISTAATAGQQPNSADNIVAHFHDLPIECFQKNILVFVRQNSTTDKNNGERKSSDSKPFLFAISAQCVNNGDGKKIGEMLKLVCFNFRTNALKQYHSKVFKQLLTHNKLRLFAAKEENCEKHPSLYICIDHVAYKSADTPLWYRNKLQAYQHDMALPDNQQCPFGPIDLPDKTGDHVNATCLFRVVFGADNNADDNSEIGKIELKNVPLPFPPIKATRRPIALLSEEDKKHPGYTPNVPITCSIPDDLTIHPIVVLTSKNEGTAISSSNRMAFFTMNTTGAAFLYGNRSDGNELMWKKCEPKSEEDRKIMENICEGKYYADCRQLIGYDLRIFMLLNRNGPINVGYYLFGEFYEIIVMDKLAGDGPKFRFDLMCKNMLLPLNCSTIINSRRKFAFGSKEQNSLCISSQFSPLPLKFICTHKIVQKNWRKFNIHQTNSFILPNDIFIKNLLF